MAAGFFPEAGGVAHILQWQLPLLKPLVPVHGTQRLLTGCNQVLVLPLTCTVAHPSCSWALLSTQQTKKCLM